MGICGVSLSKIGQDENGISMANPTNISVNTALPKDRFTLNVKL